MRKIITSLLQGLRGKQSIYRRIVSDQKRSDGADRDSRSSRSDRPRDDIPRPSSRGPDGASSRSKTPSGSSRRKPSNSENILILPVSNGSEPFIGGFAAPGTSPDADTRPSRSSTPIHSRPSLGLSNSFPTPRAYSTDLNFPRDPRTNGYGTPTPPPPPEQPLPPPPSQPPVPSHVKRFSLVDAPVPPPPAVVVTDGSTPPAPSDTPTPPISPPSESVPLDQSAPAVQTSLAALKKAEALERRASKRFSTYNISKMTGGSTRSGGGGGAGNRRSLLAANGMLTPAELAALAEEGEGASPRKKSSKSQRTRPPPIIEGEEPPPVPPLPPPTQAQTKSPSLQPQPLPPAEVAPEPVAARVSAVSAASAAESDSSSTAAPTGPFAVFLQVGREVKKVMIEPGLSLSMLRVLFVDKFAYSPGQDNFPAIYIRDPSSGVQYELEDVDEVKEKVLLSLNIEREFFREDCALAPLTSLCSPRPD